MLSSSTIPDAQKRYMNIEIFGDRVELRVPNNYKVVIITTSEEKREEEQKKCKCCIRLKKVRNLNLTVVDMKRESGLVGENKMVGRQTE
ncbi:hypothetical protein ScPMuIL_014289 [Solemya velum]